METDTRKPNLGGRPRLPVKAVQERREQIYRLHLMGWSQTEIAQSLQLSQSSVSEAINTVRSGDSWIGKTAKERYWDLIDRTKDMAVQTIREAWRQYHSSELTDKPGIRSLYLGRVQNGIKILTAFLPDAERLYMEEQVEKVRADQKKIEAHWEEERQKGKITPVLPIRD